MIEKSILDQAFEDGIKEGKKLAENHWRQMLMVSADDAFEDGKQSVYKEFENIRSRYFAFGFFLSLFLISVLNWIL